MIETLLTALAFGTIWFWVIAFVASVIIIASVENQHYPTPSIVAILLGIVYWKPIMAAPWQIIGIVAGGFVLMGLLWSVFNWHRFCSRKASYYRGQYGDTLSTDIMGRLKGELSVSHHKAMLTGWIAFWPWSLFWSLTGDFFNMLYEAMTNVYQTVANRATGKFTVADAKKPKSSGDNMVYYDALGQRIK